MQILENSELSNSCRELRLVRSAILVSEKKIYAYVLSKVHVIDDHCPELSEPANGEQRCELWGPHLKYKVVLNLILTAHRSAYFQAFRPCLDFSFFLRSTILCTSKFSFP